MVKDPFWLYAYWEIQPQVERQARNQLAPEEIGGLQSVLRVYDITDRRFPDEPAHGFFDVPLSGMASNWYIHTNAPNRSFIVEIGLLTRAGRFLMLARSNAVTTPRAAASDVIDEEWATSDEIFRRLFNVAAGRGIGMGSSAGIGLKELLASQLSSQALSSPGLSSPGLFSPTVPPKARGFWFWLRTELIVYGGTDPKASVTLQGQPIKLRPDGTFSVRMDLPDGAQTIPVQATSPDQVETRTITPIVTRDTEETDVEDGRVRRQRRSVRQ